MNPTRAFAPATIANLGVGFDILGLALNEPGDVVEAARRAEPGAIIVHIDGDGGRLTYDATRNTACIAANAVLKTVGTTDGVELMLHKGLPLASGLGSSAASAVAAAVAVNALLGEPLTKDELLPACLEGEAAVSGYHADNVAPCLYGGITLVCGLTAGEIRALPVPDGLFLTMASPAVAVPTAAARAVLPQMIPLRQMVAQTAGVARVIDALYRGDIGALAAAMEADEVIEPARAHLMPCLSEARTAAKRAGALGVVISGAGPTLCAVCADGETAARVAAALHDVYAEANIEVATRVTGVRSEGAALM